MLKYKAGSDTLASTNYQSFLEESSVLKQAISKTLILFQNCEIITTAIFYPLRLQVGDWCV